VATGRGLAVSRLSDDRVLGDLRGLIGFRVLPGTLNVRLPEAINRRHFPTYVSAAEIGASWETETGQAGYRLAPALVAGRYRGVAFQADEPGYPDDLVELMCEVHLRTALDLADGDAITFVLLDG
jgi:CTP-dependent riboflavin kinase